MTPSDEDRPASASPATTSRKRRDPGPQPRHAFVRVWLPGATEPVVAGRLDVRATRSGGLGVELLDDLGTHDGVIDNPAYAPYLAKFGADHGELRDYINTAIGAVLQWYNQHDGNLLRTLKASIDASSTPTRTPRLLHVHVNTVLQCLSLAHVPARRLARTRAPVPRWVAMRIPTLAVEDGRLPTIRTLLYVDRPCVPPHLLPLRLLRRLTGEWPLAEDKVPWPGIGSGVTTGAVRGTDQQAHRLPRPTSR